MFNKAERLNTESNDKSNLSIRGIENYNPISFKEYISGSILDSIDIFIMNEGHHLPQNRQTTLSILDILKYKGFTYLALEGLSNSDTLINSRKFPLNNSISGYYVNEPIFGNLIRSSLQLGYTVVPYEFSSGDMEKRERGQAENITKRIFDKNPKAKVLIHCGYSHGLYMDNSPRLMGYYLKLLTNKKILFFEQAQLTEVSDSSYERPDFKYVHNKYIIKEPSLFIENTKIWKLGFFDGDGALFLPKTNLINGRPHWMLDEKDRYYFPKIPKNISFPILIQAFYEQEGDLSVPIDQIEISQWESPIALILPKNYYIIRILNKYGDEVCRYLDKIQ